MKIRSIIGLLTFLITSSCIQRESKTIISDSAETKFKSGLLIENGINRGTSYTDSLETRYNIRYIPIRVTNDTIIPIRFDLAFSSQYKYPVSIDDTSFSVIVLPKEWIMNGSEVTDDMFLELPNLLNKPKLSKTLKPGETIDFGIGTVYPLPAKVCGVLPFELFSENNIDHYQDCGNIQSAPNSPKSYSSRLVLKLDFCRNEDSTSCSLISCGNITYFDT